MAKEQKHDLGAKQAEMKRQIEGIVCILHPEAQVLVTPLGKSKAVFVSNSTHGAHPVWRELHKASSYKTLLKMVQTDAARQRTKELKEGAS